MKPFAFFLLPFAAVALWLGSFAGMASAQEDVCPDCTDAYEDMQLQEELLNTQREDIDLIKEQIQIELDTIRLDTTDPIDSDFADAILEILTTSECDTDEDYEDITPAIDGLTGLIYESVFHCSSAQELEQLIAAVITDDTFLTLVDTYDPDHTSDWETVIDLFLELEEGLNAFFPQLEAYELALEEWTHCIETLLQLQAEEQCTEIDPVYEEVDLPDDEEMIECPECAEALASLEEINDDLTDLEEQMAAKNAEIAILSGLLETNATFSADLAIVFADVDCATELDLDDIEVTAGQSAGELYGQVFYCQTEESAEALIAALELFWETHEAPGDDAATLEDINTLLAEIETLQDEYNSLLVEKLILAENYEECLHLLLTLQEEGMCEESVDDVIDEIDEPIIITPPATGGSVTIPGSKRRTGSGGSSKALQFCSTALFSDITPARNTAVGKLSSISFTAASNIALGTMQLTVAGEALDLKATKNADGSYAVVANLPQALTKSGKHRVELYGANGTTAISCSRQNIYTIEIDPALVSKPAPTTENPAPPLSTVSFPDIANHWAKDFILQLAQHGVVNGYADGRFRPDNNVTRAEFTKIALKTFALGTAEVKTAPFSDVAITEWHTPFIAQAKKLAIVTGYTDNTFRPNNQITRAEGLKILVEAANINVGSYSSQTSKFPDVQKTAYYNGYVNWAVEKGIITGYTNGNFGPDDPMTRGELAKIVMNMITYLNTGRNL